MQSIIALLKGSWEAGIALNGAGGIFWFGFSTIWQVWHVLQKAATSDFILGQ